MQQNYFQFSVVAWCGLAILLASCQAQNQPTLSELEKNAPVESSDTLKQGSGVPMPGSTAKNGESRTDQESTDQEPAFFQKVGTMESDLIVECSGMAISFHQPDAFWAINDSGHSAHVFCVSLKGKLLARLELVGARNRDWESMTQVSTPAGKFLVVGDVGDNSSKYGRYQLYIFPEPEFNPGTEIVELKVQPCVIEFMYEDGARDCEGIAIDPTTHDLWLFEKLMQINLRRKPGVYRIPKDEWMPRVKVHFAAEKKVASSAENTDENTNTNTGTAQPLTLKRHCEIGHRFITGADFAPDGKQLILATYSHAIHYHRNEDQTWSEAIQSVLPTLVPLPIQRQGEAISFTADSQAILMTSESRHQPIWRVDVAGYLKLRKK
jgi:hypothetical protein